MREFAGRVYICEQCRFTQRIPRHSYITKKCRKTGTFLVSAIFLCDSKTGTEDNKSTYICG